MKLGRDNRSQGPEQEEVIPLERRAHRGGDDDKRRAAMRLRHCFGLSFGNSFSLMTRQLFMSATKMVFSDGQAMRVRPVELTHSAARGSQHAEDLAVEGHLVEPTRLDIDGPQILRGSSARCRSPTGSVWSGRVDGSLGRLPSAGWCVLSYGAFRNRKRLKLPSRSNT